MLSAAHFMHCITSLCCIHVLTDKAATKTSATVSVAAGNASQPVEKSVVTRRTHANNDYVSKKSTAVADVESTF